jgi:hypothetical protein
MPVCAVFCCAAVAKERQRLHEKRDVKLAAGCQRPMEEKMIKTFDNVEDMFAELRHCEDAANKTVAEWQKKITTGDFFVRVVSYGPTPLAIFGEIIESEYEEDRDAYKQPHLVNHRLAKCYSVACNEGEVGDVHVVSIMSKITKKQFEQARDAEWSIGVLYDWSDAGWTPDI